jgi:hypothetical protein
MAKTQLVIGVDTNADRHVAMEAGVVASCTG